MRGKYKLEVWGAKGGDSIGTTQPAKSINGATTKGGFPDGGDTKTRNKEAPHLFQGLVVDQLQSE